MSAQTSWHLDVGAPVTFSFDKYPKEAELDCNAVITMYDGSTTSSSIIFNGSIANGLPSTWRHSTTGEVLIILRNGESASTCHFEVSFYADASLYRCGSIFTPDIIKSRSMIISDGTSSSADLRRGEACTWRLLSGESEPIYDTYHSPSSTTTSAPTRISDISDENSRITLLFPWVSLKPGGRVTVRDGEGGTVLWDSFGTSTVVPPPLHSTDRSLFISYSTDTSLYPGFTGFRGEYLTQTLGSVGLGNQREVYAMSSALDITPPGYTCYGDGASSSNCVYSTGVNYTYLIKPQSTNSDSIISLMFSSLSLTHEGDSLVIHDGPSRNAPVLAKWSGQAVAQPFPYQWINSSGPEVMLNFVSQSGESGSPGYRFGGFKFSYFSDGPNYHCGFQTNPAYLHAPSQIFTDGSSMSEQILPSQNCHWSVNAPGSQGGVMLVFHRMDLAIGALLKIYSVGTDTIDEENLYVTVSNTKAVPVPIIVPNNMYITYLTTSDPLGLGFLASYITAQGRYTRSGSDDGKIYLFCSRYAFFHV